jgi:predicted nucleotidyltransferase
MSPAIDIPKARIAAFCARNRIRRLALFGSVLRPDFTADSDIDVLLEFEPDTPMGYLGLARLQRELSELLGGRKVDVKTPPALSRYFRNKVLSTSYVIYGPS